MTSIFIIIYYKLTLLSPLNYTMLLSFLFFFPTNKKKEKDRKKTLDLPLTNERLTLDDIIYILDLYLV